MDPRYKDFGEVEFLSIASYNIVEKERIVQQLKAMSVLGWGDGTNFANYRLNLVTKRTLRLRWKFKLRIVDPRLT